MDSHKEKTFKQRIFSGVQPSANQVHIGNYLGAMKSFVTLSQKYETIVCLVDLHALTSVSNPEDLKTNIYNLVSAYLAIGLDPEKVIIFKQSDVAQVTELAWYFACVMPFSSLEKAHALKDAKAKGLSPNSGLAFYPVLMAADILLYKATKVPVGKDQKQHIEMTRDIAAKFNVAYKNIFPITEPVISEETGVITGIDGNKMAKSKNNFIGLFEDYKQMKKKVMSIITDSKTLEEKKDPDSCTIFKMYSLLATEEEKNNLKDRYLAGGMGYGEAKLALVEALEREIEPLRTKFNYWINRKDDLLDVLQIGSRKAKVIAEETMSEVRKAVGVDLK